MADLRFTTRHCRFQIRGPILAKKLVIAVATLLFVLSGVSLAQKLTQLVNPAPDGAFVEYLLTDGTVMVQGQGCTDWWRLTPDKSGSYVKGTWKQTASLPSGYDPYATSGAVLADGRFLLVGGEYSNCGGSFTLTNQSAIYDPKTNKWTMVAPPKGWYDIGDSPAAVLPNGQFLLGRKTNKNMAVLDPATLKWTEVGSAGKSDFNAEEGWTLLPDGTILTYDVKNNPNSEIYDPSSQTWTSAGSTVANLQGPPQEGCLNYGHNHVYCPPGETGPGILRPDGTVFATGALHLNASTGHTAIYNPATAKWTAGPDFPNGDAAGDSFAALLPNGRVLVLGNSGTMYEFNGSTLTSTTVGFGSLIVMPTGEVLVAGSAAYTSTGTYKSSWAPKITSFPATVTRGSTYKISGQQFNGLSQAAAFGDEFGTATNYPLVRITNQSTGHVFYAKTHDHSSMGVATGKATVSTNFDVPAGMETGASSLVVVANGIPSKAVSITVE
jgi:galactose oxidase-like protein